MNGMKLVIKKSIAEDFLKSHADRKLEYFKKELLKVLDRQEKEESPEVSKAFIVHELYKSMIDPLYMAKGGKAGVVGEIRTWNGKKYKKMPNKKWVRIYDKETRGAKLALAVLRRKIDACKNSQELLNLVLENRDRFCDKLGRPLPIVQELSKYASKKNDELETLPEGRNQKEHYADQKTLKRRNAEEYNKKRAEHIRQDVDLNKVAYNQKLLSRKEAEKIIAENKNKKITNKETSLNANYGSEGAGKLISQKAVNKSVKNGYTEEEHFTIASHIKEIFEESNLISIEPDRDFDINDNVKEVRRYATEFDLNGKKGFVLMTVKLNKDETNKMYALELNYLTNKKPATSGEVKDNSNHETLTKDKPRRQQASKDNIAQDYNDVNKKIKIDIKDFPEQFNKGKWKKQTKILMDFMNSQNGDSVVKGLYKKLAALKNDLPFKIAKAEKKFANGSFSVVCDRATMKPEEQRIHIKDIADESEDLKKSSCMEALHEIMHMIDFSCRDNKNSPDYASNSNKQLVNAINNVKVSDEEIKSLEGHFADYRAKERVIIDKLNAKARENRELGKQYDSGAITTYSEYGEKYKAIQKEYEAEQKKLNELRAKEIEVSQYTDILDALSGGKLHDDKGFGGHGETYYRKESNKANEIVANYASLLAVGSEYADRLKKNYPELADSVYNLYRQFLER
jgi:hypothetical protein